MGLKILTIIDYELECYVVKDSAPVFGKEPFPFEAMMKGRESGNWLPIISKLRTHCRSDVLQFNEYLKIGSYDQF